MGRTFVTFEEASKLLKCSKRTVHTYVKKGLLRRELNDREVVLLREDVEQLAEDGGVRLPPINNRTLLELLSRLSTLEMQMSVFKKMYGIELAPPLRPDPLEAEKLVENAKFYLQKKEFTSQEVELWASMFRRMDEVTFQNIEKALERKDFWKTFFELCLHLMDYASDPKRNKQSRIWLAHHLELNESRKGLRNLILMWVELKHERFNQDVRKYLGGGMDDLMTRLVSSTGN